MTTIAPVSTSAAAAPPQALAQAGSASNGSDDGFTFDDFLDIINPLQHIPVVGTIYRAITGDTMKESSEIAGGALYGGPIGALFSLADVAFTEATGKPVDRTLLAWIGLDRDSAPSDSHPVAIAQNAAAHAPTPAAVRAGPPARSFPAATTRIVPVASYVVPSRPQPEPAATGTPHSITPMLPPELTTVDVTPAAAPPALRAAAPSPSTAANLPGGTPGDLQGADALLAALRDSGVDPASAARAAAAYQASVSAQFPLVRADRRQGNSAD